MKTKVDEVDRNIYDFKNKDDYEFKMKKGLNKDIIEEILQSGYDDYFAIEHFGSLCQLKDMEESARWLQEF